MQIPPLTLRDDIRVEWTKDEGRAQRLDRDLDLAVGTQVAELADRIAARG